MAIKATAFDNAGNWLDSLEAGSMIQLFRRAQFTYGHCLGKVSEEGVFKGWRFAQCKGNEMCSRIEVVNIIFNNPKDWKDIKFYGE